MNELDFDELDKAVNSLMSGMSTDKRNTALDDPEDKVVSLDTPDASATPTSTPASVSASSLSASVTPTTDATAEAPVADAASPFAGRPSPPLAVKRRGQFMDIVRPSSDNRVAGPAPKREGATLEPTSPFVPPALSQFGANEAGTELKPEPIAPVLDVVTPTPAAEPAFPTPAVPQPEQAAPKGEWPDPIEATGIPDTTPEVPNVTTVAESEVPADVMQEVAGPAPEEPLSSPFLPDAKVEKRPLGGAASEEPAPGPTLEAEQPAANAMLPDELKTDVMSLESTSTSTTAVELTSEVKEAPALETKKEVPQSGSGSIPQQYSEQPSSGDRTNTPIYDTSTHNQPLGSPAKKSSPMKWIIFLIVVLIIGAIAGAAYFYFTTQ